MQAKNFQEIKNAVISSTIYTFGFNLILMQAYSWLKPIQDAYKCSIDSVQPLGFGHIHQTYKITSNEGRYVLQQLNVQVFTNPQKISHNHALVKEGLKGKDLPFELPLPIPNQNGELFTNVEGSLFRLSPFVDGVCLEEINHTTEAFLAAEAFAGLIAACASMETVIFEAIIPGFNDLELRFQQLLDAVGTTRRAIDDELQELIDFYLGQTALVQEYKSWIQRVPQRVTHNDTKINNLIYSKDRQQVIAVIDLDTIMAGYAFYDFGDLVRTVACTQPESSTDWQAIGVDPIKYRALWEGFLAGGNQVLTDDEKASLVFGGQMMTCIMGFRFLADYLNGNIYYSIQYEEQNRHRAKNHMCLLQALLAFNFHP